MAGCAWDPGIGPCCGRPVGRAFAINSSLENYDTILRTLFDIDPEVVVLLAVTFPDELGIMRTRQHRPGTVRVVAAVAGIGDFSAELAQIADGALGPRQWEPGVTFPNVTGPASDWFLDNFRRQFGQTPDYIAGRQFRDRIGCDGMYSAGGFLG